MSEVVVKRNKSTANISPWYLAWAGGKKNYLGQVQSVTSPFLLALLALEFIDSLKLP